MDQRGIIIAVLIVLVMGAAFFSMAEAAYCSINKIKLKNMAEAGSRKAKKALRLAENADRLSSTLLIGSHVMKILACSLATVLFVQGLGYGDSGIALATVVMSVVMLLFAEISPKCIVREAPEKWAVMTANAVSVIQLLLTPINFLFGLWRKLLARLFQPEQDDSLTQEDLLTIVEEAQNEGDLQEHESDLICAAIEFNDLDVKDVLTPRVDVVAVDVTDVDDTPGTERGGTVQLGRGAAVKIMDSSVICHPAVVEKLEEIAGAEEIPVQRDILRAGGTDAGSIHITRSGVRTGGISVPCRYVHAPTEMVHLGDAEACVRLVQAFAKARLEAR